MFERYTEEARRVVFFARYEASVFDSPEINSTHLLLGLLREGAPAVHRYLKAGSSIEALQRDLASSQPKTDARLSTSVDLPLSFDAKLVLACAGEEAERLEQRQIGLIHLLLALTRDQATAAILETHGIRRADVLNEATAVGKPEADLDARHRLAELIRTVPPELLPDAERTLRTVLAARFDVRASPSTAGVTDSNTETTRSFWGGAVSVIDSVYPGTESGTVEYAVKVQASGEQRSWRTTFRIPSSSPSL